MLPPFRTTAPSPAPTPVHSMALHRPAQSSSRASRLDWVETRHEGRTSPARCLVARLHRDAASRGGWAWCGGQSMVRAVVKVKRRHLLKEFGVGCLLRFDPLLVVRQEVINVAPRDLYRARLMCSHFKRVFELRKDSETNIILSLFGESAVTLPLLVYATSHLSNGAPAWQQDHQLVPDKARRTC
jgi:hypothetical protein